MKRFVSMMLLVLAGVTCAAERQTDSTPELDNSLSVLAYNIYMIVQAPAKSERAALLEPWLRGYDVVILNEAFHDGIRTDIRRAVRDEYPYATSVLGSHPALSFPPRLENGGVTILSRWPIEMEDERTFGFTCVWEDCLANKGVKYARINKYGQRYHIFGSHTQAGTGMGRDGARSDQLEIIAEFVLDLKIPAAEAVIIGGDLNVDRYDSQAYSDMLATLNAWHPEVLGHPYTNDRTQNPLAGGRSFLDYVVLSRAHRMPVHATVETFRPLAARPWDASTRDLSDHYPVYGRLWFVPPPGQVMVAIGDIGPDRYERPDSRRLSGIIDPVASKDAAGLVEIGPQLKQQAP